jgi:hypothetical protein
MTIERRPDEWPKEIDPDSVRIILSREIGENGNMSYVHAKVVPKEGMPAEQGTETVEQRPALVNPTDLSPTQPEQQPTDQ